MDNGIGWRLTDPDNLQYGRRLSTYVFEFKEYDRNNYKPNNLWIRDTIDLTTFSFSDIANYIEGYYDNMDELCKIYGADSCFIIAECIFEQTNGLY